MAKKHVADSAGLWSWRKDKHSPWGSVTVSNISGARGETVMDHDDGCLVAIILFICLWVTCNKLDRIEEKLNDKNSNKPATSQPAEKVEKP